MYSRPRIEDTAFRLETLVLFSVNSHNWEQDDKGAQILYICTRYIKYLNLRSRQCINVIN